MAEAPIHGLALSRIPGVGPAVYRRLKQRFGSAGAAFDADRESLKAALSGIAHRSQIVAAMLAGPDQNATNEDLAWLSTTGRHLVEIDEPGYPACLAEIADPPPVLFIRGDLRILETPQIAIVGSRKASTGGRRFATELAGQLAEAGLVVTSGLAEGIDSAAHRGALQKAGGTIAVLGTGIDLVYPVRAVELARAIESAGALVSEFPVGTPPRAVNFPRRNRIISGLCLGVVVVEAAERSGSLITARLAAEQGREVFAVPGQANNPSVRGCHALIKEGATLVESATDILAALLPQLTLHVQSKPVAVGSALGEVARRILEFMDHDAVSVDDIAVHTGLTTAEVSTMLLKLELDGQIAPSPGGRFVRS